MKRWLKSLHQNDRGTIAVLVLLTIWCLVALLGMIWNNAEYAMKRQQVQNAADAAAQDSALWMSRTLNVVTGQNMAICRDASAEAIWRASKTTGGDPATGTPGTIATELNREDNDAKAGRTRVGNLQRQLQTLCTRIEVEYELTHTALQTLTSNLPANLTDATTQKNYATTLRQATSALNYVENTYLNGQTAPNRLAPPGPNGEGLYQLVAAWNITQAQEQAIFQFIDNYITSVEMPELQAFQTQVYPATSQSVDQRMQTEEAAIFAQQINERTSTPATIDRQRQQVQDFYNTHNKMNVTISLATTKQVNPDQPLPSDGDSAELGLAGSGTVGAAVATPEEVDGTIGKDYDDSIRNSSRIIPYTNPPLTYADQAALLQLPAEFDIDPINPHTPAHTGLDGTDWADATLWHPDIPIALPNNQLFTVRCNVPGGWGHLWLMPIERQLNERIWNDQSHLRTNYMQPQDNLRWLPPHTTDLAGKIWKMQNLPTNFQIAALPSKIMDDTKNDQGGYDTIPVLPVLQNPPNSQSSFTSEVTVYNTHSRSYLSFVAQLRTALLLYQSIYAEFYVPFAVFSWDNAVNGARNVVMGAGPVMDGVTTIHGLAQNGTFMILPTYKLRNIPPWAQPGMEAAIQEQVAEHIVEMNVQQLIQVLGGRNVNGAAIRPFADEAMQLLQAEAQDAGQEIAAEWVKRPWPYEIAPPGFDSQSRPPLVPLGIPKSDRQNFFSAMAFAVNNNSPSLMFSPFFPASTPLTAYAQGETFNWMEFNSNYGGNEQFDNSTRLPYGNYDSSGTYFGEIGCPRGWRLSSTGGWNWQPRLSAADALPQTLHLNPDVQALFPNVNSADATANPLIRFNVH